MNALSQTKIYNRIGKIFGSLEKTLGNLNFTPYTVPIEMYMDYYVEMFKTYNYPLARVTMEACKNQIIRPCLLSEPYNKDVKELSKVIPQNIFTFGAIDQKTKDLVCYVDTSMKGKYKYNKITETIDTYKIDPSNFYAYMQSGLIFHFCKKNNAKLSNAKTLLKEIATCFIVLLSKVIDSKLSISANREDYHILLFLCGCFFYESLCGYTKERAIENVKQINFIMKDGIRAKCHYLNSEINMGYNSKDIEKDFYPIDMFVNIVSQQFNLGEKINYRDVVTWWSNLYGSQSIAAIEDSTTFIIMIMMVQLRANFYNDMIMISALKKQMADLPKLFLTLMT